MSNITITDTDIDINGKRDITIVSFSLNCNGIMEVSTAEPYDYYSETVLSREDITKLIEALQGFHNRMV